MSTAQGRGRAGGAPRTSWRDRRSNDDSKSAGGRDDVSSRGGSGGYRGRGGARSSTRGARSAPAPRERTHERKDHVTNKDDTAADATNAPRPSPSTLGTCTQMCPRAEVHERTRTMEISRFERPPPGAFVPSHGDVFSLAVKKYRRAAAGQIELDSAELRPPHVLLHTLQHLFSNVLPWSGCGFDWPATHSNSSSVSLLVATERVQLDFLSLYHFLSDRVRSVRKDFTIQRIEDGSAVQALETIVRFHLLTSFRARTLLQPTLQLNDWSETLNDQQLVSALAQLQVLYQKANSITTQSGSGGIQEGLMVTNYANQSEFVAYDILLHADDPRAVSFLLVKVPEQTRRSEPVKRALALFVALQTQDFHTFACNFQTSSPLEKSLLLKHLPKMWTSGVLMLNKAFGKQNQFRIEEFMKWLSLPGIDAAQRLCSAMNLHTEAPPAPVLEALPVSSPVASDSWEDADVQAPSAPVGRQPPPQPAAAGFIRFKVSPLNAELEKDTMERLLVDTAQRVFLEEVHGLHRACDLILNRRQETTK